MIKENCFAFRSLPKKKGGFEWSEDRCDCLTEFLCDKRECPFFKDKSTVTKYQFKYGTSKWSVGYADNERKILSSEI